MPEFRTEKGNIRVKGTVKLLMKSPFFNTDQLKGTFSFPFKHPLFPSENKQLDFPSKLTAVRSNESIPASLFKNGLNIMAGDFTVQNAEGKFANSIFKGSASRFAKYFGETYMDEIDLGELEIGATQETLNYLNALKLGDSSTYPFALPYLDAFEVVDIDDEGLNDEYFMPKVINWQDENGNIHLTEPGGYKKLMVCPSIYTLVFLNKLFEQIGYQFINSINDSELIKKMVIVGITNISDVWGYPIARDVPLNKFLPHYKISSFILDLQNLFGLVFIFNDQAETVTLKFKKDVLQKSTKPPLKVKHEEVKTDYSKIYKGVKWSASFDDNIMKAVLEPALAMKLIGLGQAGGTVYDVPISEENKYRRLIDLNVKISVPGENNTWSWEDYDDYEQILEERIIGESKYLELKSKAGFLHNVNNIYNCSIGAELNSTKEMAPTFIFIMHHIPDIKKVANYYYNNGLNMDWFRNSGFAKANDTWFEFIMNAKPIKTNIILTNAQLKAWDWEQTIQIESTLVLPSELEPDLSGSNEIKATLKGYTL